MEKYGFVYIWYDRKYPRFYIGCHWGHEDDGYVCSSVWMRNAYNRRSHDFKRRILARVYTNRSDLIDEEYRWLQMIDDRELSGVRYYNKNKFRRSHWSENGGYEISRDRLNERNRKISSSQIGKKLSEDHKESIRKSLIGRTLTEEHKKNISKNHTRIYDEEFRQKMSVIAKNRSNEQMKNFIEARPNGMLGKKHSEETKEKMRISAKKRRAQNISKPRACLDK